MEPVSRQLIRHSRQLAQEIGARALVVYVDALDGDGQSGLLAAEADYPVILVTRSTHVGVKETGPGSVRVTVPNVRMSRAGLIKAALLPCLARGVLQRGDRVVCLTGLDGSHSLDALVVLDLATEPELFAITSSAVLAEDVQPEVFERILTLATELAVEGREGRPVGAIFVVGDSERVLVQSRRLVLNPFKGYPESERSLLDSELEETIKELSALDGAFVIRGDGVVLSAGTQLLPTVAHARLPSGLGTRHAAAAGITASTQAIAVCISQSTGAITVFRSGQLLAEIQRPASGSRPAL
jgi:DNA integrity scanning protein DisA with diadenylate cyclase activity